jgi:hypothetical protein
MQAAFGTTPISSFLGVSFGVGGGIQHNTKVFISGYQSIDMCFIVVPVEFDGGLYISVLRNKQLFTKKKGQKFTFSKKFQFSNPASWKKDRPLPREKSQFYWTQFFL